MFKKDISIFKNNKIIKYTYKVLKILSFSVFLIVVLLLLFSTLFLGSVKDRAFLGFKPYIVLSNSMEPLFSAGDLIIIKKLNSDEINSGDIITFYSIDPLTYNEVITHKVIRETTYNDEIAYVTKGLNNDEEDIYPATEEKIIGQYQFKINKFGFFIDYLKTDAGYIIFILIPFISLILLEVFGVVKKIKKEKESYIKKLIDEKKQLEDEISELKKQK